MKEKMRDGMILGMVILMYAILIHKEEWLISTLLCILLILLYVRGVQEYKGFESQLIEISEMLELLIQKNPISSVYFGKDTLFEKITTQIHRISEINLANEKMLGQKQEDMKQFLAEISHQIRTPLANMETYLALLEETSATEEEKQSYLKSVMNAEQKIHFLIEKFMIAARMENRIIQIHKRVLDLKETVAEAVFQVYQKAQKKKIYIEVQEEKGREKLVWHDKNWMCESIYNLLDNSIKYSPEDSKIIVHMKDNEMFTEISIEDEGIGIAPEEENKIFQLYYRGENTYEQEGFGMGLYITREIVKKHDGFMRVKRKKQGLLMSIFLPKAGT